MLFYQLLISHFIFDYGYAIRPSMVKAKSDGYPIFPILLHAFLHSLGVLLVLLLNGYDLPKIFSLSFFQLMAHFLIDLIKSKIENKYPSLKSHSNPLYWHLFQLDQFLHISCMFIISIL